MTQQPLVHGRPAASTPVTVLQELELFKRTSENCQLTPAVINDLGHCRSLWGHCGVTVGSLQVTVYRPQGDYLVIFIIILNINIINIYGFLFPVLSELIYWLLSL